MRNKYNVVNKRGSKTSNQEDEFVEYMKKLGFNFQTQKKFILQEGFEFEGEKIKPITYTPDLYFPEDNLAIDYKGTVTDVYKIKKKLFLKRYGIKLVEVKKAPKYFLKATGFSYGTIEALELCKAVKSKITGSNVDIEHKVTLEINQNFEILKRKGYAELRRKNVR